MQENQNFEKTRLYIYKPRYVTLSCCEINFTKRSLSVVAFTSMLKKLLMLKSERGLSAPLPPPPPPPPTQAE